MTISKYISFWSALNVIDPNGNSGDWHPVNLLPENLAYAGRNCAVNTLPWLGEKDILTYPDYDSLDEWCLTRNHWVDLPAPYFVANHRRATVDLLFRDFVTRRGQGRSVYMYGWIDTNDLIQSIMDDFQIIVDDLANTVLGIDPTSWRTYRDWIWKMAE